MKERGFSSIVKTSKEGDKPMIEKIYLNKSDKSKYGELFLVTESSEVIDLKPKIFMEKSRRKNQDDEVEIENPPEENDDIQIEGLPEDNENIEIENPPEENNDVEIMNLDDTEDVEIEDFPDDDTIEIINPEDIDNIEIEELPEDNQDVEIEDFPNDEVEIENPQEENQDIQIEELPEDNQDVEIENPPEENNDVEIMNPDDTEDVEIENPQEDNQDTQIENPDDRNQDGNQNDNQKGPGLEYDSTRKYNLFKEYMSLYNAIDNYISKLEDSISDDPITNQGIKLAVSKLREIKDLTYDYMMIKFEICTYVQSLLFYQNLVVSVQLVFKLIINSKKNSLKNNK